MGEQKTQVALETTGMHCPSCAKMIEMTLRKEAGVGDVKADYPAGRTDVVYDPDVISEADIIAKIEGLGYKASPAK